MRKICISIIFICLIISFSIYPFASNSSSSQKVSDINKSFIESMYNSQEQERKELTAVIQGNSNELYSVDSAYKVCATENMLLTAYQKNNKVSDVLTQKYKWYVPASSDSQSLAVVPVVDGKLSSAGFSQGVPALLSKESLIKDVTKGSAEIGNITSITPAYNELYKTVFVFITSDNGEFCIPYAQKEDEMGLDNGKVYKTDDMMRTLNKRFDESIYINNPDSNFGELPYRQSSAPYAIIIISAVCVTAIAVIGIYLFRTRKSKAK